MSREAVGGTFWRSPGWPNPVWVWDNADHLAAPHYKLGEMLQPNVPPIEMRSPGARSGLGLLDVPASNGTTGGSLLPQFYSGPVPGTSSTGGGGGLPAVGTPGLPPGATSQVNPVFFDVRGNVITQATCGDIYSMTVPGYEGQTLNIVQTKNGALQF